MSRSRPSARVQAAVAVLIVLVILGRGLLAGAGDDQAGPDAPATQASRAPAAIPQGSDGAARRSVRIRQVIDGDTLEIDEGGTRRRVRLLGIDSPESTTLRNGHVECGGDAAKAFTTRLAQRWPTVDLVSDPSQDAEDQYGRILAYVQPAGVTGTTFQELILTAGLARVYVYDRHPFRRVSVFRAAAALAQKQHHGVWADCGGNFRRPLT